MWLSQRDEAGDPKGKIQAQGSMAAREYTTTTENIERL